MGVRWRISAEEQPLQGHQDTRGAVHGGGRLLLQDTFRCPKIVFVYAGASALAGYESVNWGEKVLHDGSTLHDRDAFIYGGALTLDVEFYVADRIALLANLRERCLWGGDTRKFHTQWGWASSSSSTDTPHGTDGNRRHEANTPCGLSRTAGA